MFDCPVLVERNGEGKRERQTFPRCDAVTTTCTPNKCRMQLYCEVKMMMRHIFKDGPEEGYRISHC